jgi:hypothetical protein
VTMRANEQGNEIHKQLAIQNRCHPHRDWLVMPVVHSVGNKIDTLDRMEDGAVGVFACGWPEVLSVRRIGIKSGWVA